MKRVWKKGSSARSWGKAAAVFTMAMVLAAGGMGAAMNLADPQDALTVQPIVRQESGTEQKHKAHFFWKKQAEQAASSEEGTADENLTAEEPAAQAQPEEAAQQTAAVQDAEA